MMEKMKPCPFCGKEETIVYGNFRNFWVECFDPECGVRGPEHKTEAEAIAAWNTRPREDELELAVKTVADFVRESERSEQARQAVEYQNVIDDLKEKLNTRPREREWISVEDRLPEEGDMAGKMYPGEYNTIGYRFAVLINWYGRQSLEMDNYSLETGFGYRNVTHWMSIPQPPEREEE